MITCTFPAAVQIFFYLDCVSTSSDLLRRVSSAAQNLQLGFVLCFQLIDLAFPQSRENESSRYMGFVCLIMLNDKELCRLFSPPPLLPDTRACVKGNTKDFQRKTSPNTFSSSSSSLLFRVLAQGRG